MTKDQLLTIPELAKGVQEGTIEITIEPCCFCHGIGGRHLGRSAEMLSQMRYASPEFCKAERTLPRTRCINCDGTGYEAVPLAVEQERGHG